MSSDKTRRLFTYLAFLLMGILSGLPISAQQWGGGRPGGGGGQMNIGHFYGKIVDQNGKGVSYASVQILKISFDTLAKKQVETLVAGQITAENGEFSLKKLPIRGPLTLRVSVLGYAEFEQQVSFGKPGGKPGGGGRPGGSGGWGGAGGGSSFDKDLGNIQLTAEVMALDDVVIEGEANTVTLALDKKVFKVDKNSVSVGGTAEDALANVPSLSVDIDGNLTLRNAAPQLFIDGRPTPLTLDQIAADEIESVEVITNPSAKYDASGGQAGIVNIVLKKERRIGYNGSIRGGVDTRLGYNAGGNINIREGKVNIFLSANNNNRVSKGEGQTIRQNIGSSPQTINTQNTTNEFVGNFMSLRGGVDWFLNNRNTLTFSGSFRRGRFTPEYEIDIITDTLGLNTQSKSRRITDTDRGFQNIGGSILFKHLFPKEGREWTADVNYNEVSSDGTGLFSNQYDTFSTNERQESTGGSRLVTVQTDLVEPINKAVSLEYGARAAVREFSNNNASYLIISESEEVRLPNFADEYEFLDAIYAAYANVKHQFPKWGYMAGLRVESSSYTGKLPETGDVFENDYPFSLFPSLFLTRKLNEQDNLQFSYSRRINRPSFFKLMPFTDFSDSLNLRRGNPDLLPEFTNSFEATYQNILSKGHDILVSAYYKQASDLITTFQTTELIGGKEVLMTSYANSNSSYAYGMEFTMRNTFGKRIELTSNVNLYNSRVDASNVQTDLINEQFTWFVKENLVVKLPAQFRLQINGQYQSRAAFTPSNGSSRFFGWRSITNTAQGYTLPYWFVDVALRKDLFKRKASLTVSMRDVFATRETGTYTETGFFIQDTWRIRNPQLISVNFSYRFGKPDASIFKRKNNNINMQGSDMMGG